MPAPRIRIVAALTALTAAGYGVHYLARLRRALDAERAARRLTAGMHGRDIEAFTVRLNEAVYRDAVLTEADLVLDSALATHHDPEGGSQ